ncbi:transglycosylase SLT domain-containing protein [Roseobacter sp. HKCCA0434]|uniref:transglycosylase SLT domain-containing protein n=1 Tax=Roseobacter sp. HKCCA0434 TaxID=3079297 RepID=UPI0029059AD2|nr:transglycosylase SLT domain-containing protein [Roseobacter sp. HKCCA0434]
MTGLVRLAGAIALCLLAACGRNEPEVARPIGNEIPPSNTLNICAIFAEKPHWRRDMEVASAKWGTPVEVMMGIMWRESRFRQHASPGTSSAYGYSQAINGTWAWYQDATGNHAGDRTRFSDAADFIGWYMNETLKQNGLSFYDSYAQYLAYHEGHNGFRRGTYWEKDFLLRAAGEVRTMVEVYRTQLNACPSRMV